MPEGNALRPTLWRTCRVLANRRRLRILGWLLAHPNQSVSSVAQRLRLSLPVTSRYLRALEARGLTRTRRAGPWVCYRPEAHPSVPGAIALLKAIRRVFATADDPVEMIYRNATAFTHPRRLRIMRVLGASGRTMESLRREAGLSRRALSRHLRKLASRRFVVRQADRCRRASPRGRFARVLLELACGQ